MPSRALVYLTLVQMRARGDKGVALLEDAAFGSIAQTIVSATNRQPLDLLGFKRCKNVLRYVRAWRQVYATAHACVTPTPNSVQSFAPDNLQSDSAAPAPQTELVPAGENHLSSLRSQLPEILTRAGSAAVFAAEEFFYGRIRNEHTRSAYLIAIKRFLAWAETHGIELRQITPKDVGQYFDGLRKENTSISTRKQHLAALRHFFDGLVTRHAIILNPALSVRGERYQVVEGKTPEITVTGARTLLTSIDTAHVVGLRDRAIIAVLIYTISRAGAVAKLRCGSFYHAGEQWMLHFDEKNGKSREIPVRHNLEQMLFEYLDAAGLRNAHKDTPLFRTAYKKTGQLTSNALHVVDVCRMFKRRLRDAGLPPVSSPHSVRVTGITDLLEQGVAMEDVQRLAGHADPRTTKLYDRRQKKIMRNIVERISI